MSDISTDEEPNKVLHRVIVKNAAGGNFFLEFFGEGPVLWDTYLTEPMGTRLKLSFKRT